MTPLLAPERPSDTNELPTGFPHPVGTTAGPQLWGKVSHIRATSSSRQPSSQLQEILDRSQAFRQLADEWHQDTDIISSPTKKKNHRAYRRILAMGMAAIPYILRDLRDRGGDWYEALIDITGESPVPPDAQGDVDRMNRHWLSWGKEKGFLV